MWLGDVGTLGLYKFCIRPTSVATLQQAELFALYTSIKIASYIRRHMVSLGRDSDRWGSEGRCLWGFALGGRKQGNLEREARLGKGCGREN